MKKLHAREHSRNQPIPCFDFILQHDWPIEQRLLHIRVFFGGKTKSTFSDLFIHWLIKQITNTYRNIFQGRTKIVLSKLAENLLHGPLALISIRFFILQDSASKRHLFSYVLPSSPQSSRTELGQSSAFGH